MQWLVKQTWQSVSEEIAGVYIAHQRGGIPQPESGTPLVTLREDFTHPYLRLFASASIYISLVPAETKQSWESDRHGCAWSIIREYVTPDNLLPNLST